jgi:cytochrome c-type biogenesis protein CcmH/NrfF
MDVTDAQEIERLYRAVADGEPQREILQLIYDLFGEHFDLRPPVAELRLASLCGTGGGVKRG